MPDLHRRALWCVYVVAACVFGYLLLNVCAEVFGPGPLGVDLRFRDGRAVVVWVAPGLPAASAGIQRGDVIVAIEDRTLRTLFDWRTAVENVEAARPFTIDVASAGQNRPVQLELKAGWQVWSVANWVTFGSKLAAQVGTFVLALLIATRRFRERVAVLGALFLASLTITNFAPVIAVDPQVPDMPAGSAVIWRALPLWLGAPLWVGFLVFSLGPLVMLQFFAEFPRPAFHTPRAWRIWALVWAPAVIVGEAGLFYSASQTVYSPQAASGLPGWFTLFVGVVVLVAVFAGGSLLVRSFHRVDDRNERRRLRVLVVGTIVGLAGLVPITMAGFFNLPAGASGMLRSPVVLAGAHVLFLVLPASFAYAILRHQVFRIGFILRQGLQYAMARRLVASLVPACAVLLAVDLFVHGDQPFRAIMLSRGWVYAVVAGVAIAAHLRRQHWLEAIDKRFFRERYDAQRLLSQVVEDIRRAGDLPGVAVEVVSRVAAALHPRYVAVLVREPRELTYRVLASVPAEGIRLSLARDSKLAALARLLGKPLELGLSQSGSISRQLPPEEADFVRQAGLGLIVPVATPDEGIEVLLALGVKLSEEPYSSDDQQLLGAIAASLALLVERPSARPAADVFVECPQCGMCDSAGVVTCSRDGAALSEVRLPRVLGERYRLDRRLGRGGMGTVYEAADLELNRSVGVKVIREELVGSPAAADRFRREARAAAGFSHPNVVVVHDFGVIRDTRAFLVMELLRGSSLRDVLRREGRLPGSRVVSILRDLAAAVDAAHARHLVHRDLKPENVFLVGDGADAQVKLLDFGLAKFLAEREEKTAATATVTTPGQIVGTVHYMGPEQSRGNAVGIECDLWAIGVMAYEMLTGALPFEGVTAVDYQSSVLSGRFTPVETRLPGAPAGLQGFFAGAFALEPAGRPSRAPLFVAELERALA
jgi:hypothetical protein